MSFATSQKNLQTEYVDSLVLHSPMTTYEDTLTVWRAMENIYAAGNAHQLGIRCVLTLLYDLTKTALAKKETLTLIV